MDWHILLCPVPVILKTVTGILLQVTGTDDPCTNVINDPAWYASDLVDKIIKADVNHEIACHTFSHLDFLLYTGIVRKPLMIQN